MRFFSGFAVLVLSAGCAFAGAREGAVLEYRIKARLQDEDAWVESGFRVRTTPALITRNKVKKPRMGTWRIEPLAVNGVWPSSALLARAGTLLYFSGPAPKLTPCASSVVLGAHSCRLWQAEVPTGVAAYVYLAEVAPSLLALSYLSASLAEGDFGALEIHLVRVELGAQSSPAEEGATLMRTLARWGANAALAASPQGQESEQID